MPTLPFTIEPSIWPLTAAAGLLLFWVYRSSPDNLIKQLWWSIIISKFETAHRWRRRPGPIDMQRLTRSMRVMFWIFEIFLIAATAASVLVFVGVLRNPPQPAPRVMTQEELDKTEIVVNGQTIYARPKGPATQPGDQTLHVPTTAGAPKP